MTSRTSNRRTEAFTLIEVVMAMAVVAFALVAIAGLMPMGLQSMRDSQNDQAIGTIANQLRGDLQQIPFGSGTGTLGNLSSTTNYYTTEGVKTDMAGATAGAPYYRASFAVTNAAVNGSAYSSASVTSPNNAAVVTVTLGYPYNPNNPGVCPQTNSFSLFATKQVGL